MEGDRQSVFRSRILWNEYCGRCEGTLILDIDREAGFYKSCITCGDIVYLEGSVRRRTDPRYQEKVLVD